MNYITIEKGKYKSKKYELKITSDDEVTLTYGNWEHSGYFMYDLLLLGGCVMYIKEQIKRDALRNP